MKLDEDLFRRYMEMHQNPTNRALHITAMFGSWASLAAALVTRKKRYLLGIPVFYGMAILGHRLFEKNEPTFVRIYRERGFDVKTFARVFLVEEACVFRMAMETFGIVAPPSPQEGER
jgi:hypothetical protein